MRLECCGYSMDGEITICIHNKRKTSTYTYTVDAAHIPGWIKRIPYQPGRVLNEIKKNATFTIKESLLRRKRMLCKR